LPLSQGPKKDYICYATQNRQDAVKALAEQCDLVIVVGSPNSSNSRRLREVAITRGVAGLPSSTVRGQEQCFSAGVPRNHAGFRAFSAQGVSWHVALFYVLT